MQADLETTLYKFGRNPAICLREEAICAKSLQTDRWTDNGRRAIVLAHGISKKSRFSAPLIRPTGAKPHTIII